MKIALKDLSGGVNTDKEDYEVPDNQWTDVNNVTFRDGKIQKAKGYTEVYTGLGCRPQWILPYEDPESGDYHWIYPGVDDNDYGKIYTVTSTTHTNRTRKTDAATSAISTTGSPTTVTIASTTYNDGDEVTISGVTTAPDDINGTYTLTKVSDTQFTIVANVTSAADPVGTASIDSDYTPIATIPWSGGVLNGLVIINNGNDIPQKWDRTSGTLKDNFEDLANWPAGYKARIIRPFRDFLIAMDITVSGAEPTRNPYRVMWSDAATGFSEPSAWLAAANNLAGDIYLADGGEHVIDGAQLRGNFYIYKENSTYVMRYVGGNTVMAVDRLFNDIGILAPRCLASFGQGFHFVVTKGDVVVHDGNTVRSVADDIVKHTIFDEIDSTNYVLSWCTPYYKEEEIWFCYPTTDAFVYKAAIWNYKTGAWSFRDLPKSTHIAYGIVDDSSLSATWDSDSGTWDSDITTWGEFVYSPSAYDLMVASRGSTDNTASAKFYQIDSSNQEDGANMVAYARKTGIDLEDPQSVKYMKRLYPVLRDGPVQFRVGYSMAQEGPYNWCAPVTYTTDTDHKLDVRCTGRYMAIEIQSIENVDWGLDQIVLEFEMNGLR